MRIISVLILICASLTASSQDFFRIRADFSIKAKLHTGKSQLTMGTVYYDKNLKIIIYKTSFPGIETWVVKDTLLYKIENNKIINKTVVPFIAEFSIFHLSLNGNLSDYGLKKSCFTIDNVEKQNDMVITTWIPPVKYHEVISKILVSNKNKHLFGIVFLNGLKKLVSKHFFKKYQNISGLEFPTEIVKISYTSDGQENYEMTTYRNIVVNDFMDDSVYNFKIPNKK